MKTIPVKLLAVIVAGLSPLAVAGQDLPKKTAPPPPAPPPGKVDEALAYRIKSLTRVTPKTVEFEGALMRIRQRAQRHELARNPGEAQWMRGVDNISFDSITGRPQGINIFTIKF